ncbi:MAG TPA: hypothetical protein VGN36_04870 [Sphingorhabdus sp.]|nr:hypothetical protein [Sphingorhabdus sp.]
MEKILLIEQLDNMRIEPDGAMLTFPARLAQENGWAAGYANRVFDEYRRFLFLAATCPHSVTPSDEVDQAWHLHLTYTRHYWDTLCGEILIRPLHHGPTLGGANEGQRYRAQYQRTLDAYALAFGENPPADIWPDAKRRFDTEYRRIEIGQHWMVPKKAGYAVIPLVTLAACTPGEWVAGGLFAVLGAVVGTIGIAAISGEKGQAKKKDGSGCGTATATTCTSDDCSSTSSGCGGGGCGGGCGS